MRIRKTVLRIVLLVVVLLLAAAGYLYYKASRVPEAYKPANLTQEERKQEAKRFVNRVAEFSNEAQKPEPYDWRITQEELNRYLASMDEIAAALPGEQRGDVQQQMADAGVSAPAVAMGDGVLTLMVRAPEYNKVLSVDITFSYTPEGLLLVRLAQTRVGDLVVPPDLVRDRLDQLKKTLSAQMAKDKAAQPPRPGDARSRRTVHGATAQDVSRLLAAVISAIDEAPIKPEIVVPPTQKHVRIAAIHVEPGVATLRIIPVPKKPGNV